MIEIRSILVTTYDDALRSLVDVERDLETGRVFVTVHSNSDITNRIRLRDDQVQELIDALTMARREETA